MIVCIAWYMSYEDKGDYSWTMSNDGECEGLSEGSLGMSMNPFIIGIRCF